MRVERIPFLLKVFSQPALIKAQEEAEDLKRLRDIALSA